MTLYQLGRLPDVHRVTPAEATSLEVLSNNVYDALEPFQFAEQRRDDVARVMVEAAQKFLEKGL